jgi:YD repeat-containing protein
VLETFDYTYDAVGNPTVLAEANGDRVTWTYDALSQLIGDVRGGASSYAHTYTYDAVGNRAARGTTDYTYDAANQLTLRDADGALTTYSYDANGNLLAQEKAAGTTTFTWGYENELLTSLEPDGDLVTMIPPSREWRPPAAAARGRGDRDQLRVGSRAGPDGAQRGGRDGGAIHPRPVRLW